MRPTMPKLLRASSVVVASALLAVGAAAPAHADPRTIYDTGLNLADPGFIATDAGVTIHGTGPGFPASSASSYNGTYAPIPAEPSMTDLPDWIGEAPTMGKRLWAPSVITVGTTYVMYYTAWHDKQNRNCIGVATSSAVRGPFVADGGPLCAPDDAGDGAEAIDPSAYVSAEGNCYMVFKTSLGNRSNFKIWAKPTGEDCVTRGFDAKVKLARKSKIEAPFVLNPRAVDGGVYLFVSRQDYTGCGYNVEVWRADSLWEGTFAKKDKKVLMDQSSSGMCGPGGATLTETPSGTRIAFHAWDTANPATDDMPTTNTRSTYTAQVLWDKKGRPHVM